MFFMIWWNEVGRRWVCPLYYGSILSIGLYTGIIDITIIPLIVLISMFFGVGLLLWFILLEHINR